MMKKKTKRWTKSITALIMSAVLLVTSMPLVLAGGGSYNPIPYFVQEEVSNTVSSWVEDDGSVAVQFPQAVAGKTYDNKTQKTITGYLLEIYDLGPANEAYTETRVFAKKIAATTGVHTEVISVEELANIPVSTALDTEMRYSIAVTAIDSEGWLSESIHAQISDVPEFTYDEEAYKPLTNNANAMREMIAFEGAVTNSGNDNCYSTNGNGGGSMDYVEVGGTLSMFGRTDQTGVENSSGKDSYGYRLRINAQPSATEGQRFDTSWSRSLWDFSGAEEIWFWMDLSQVDLQGLSFRLRTNEKRWNDWSSFSRNSNEYLTSVPNDGDDKYSSVVYSTKGYTGNDAYVYVQQPDGSWQKVMLTNGALDLGHFKGYVRVPLQFICSETESRIDFSNQSLGEGTDFTSGLTNVVQTDNANAWLNSLYFTNGEGAWQSILVDPAGTPVSDALLLQRRTYKSEQGIGGLGGVWVWNFDGNMLAAGSMNEDIGNGRAAYVDENGVIQNRESGYKALEDLMAAGFSYTGTSADSVDKSFYLDNILFYRTDGGQYSDIAISGSSDVGQLVSNYYDQMEEVPKIILSQIGKYITDPDWGDYRAVQYIDDLIAGYRKSFADEGRDTAFLEDSALAAKAASFDVAQVWQNYVDAKQACIDGGTWGSNNIFPNELVPQLESDLEKLPEADSLLTASSAVRQARKVYIDRLRQIYKRLNLGQLQALGRQTEAKLLDYCRFFDDQFTETVLGQQLTDNPFIPFNTFETQTIGTRAWQLENDPNFNSVNNDYQYTKGFLIYTTTFRDFAGYTYDISGSSVSRDPMKEGFSNAGSLRENAASATIGMSGASGTRGATITLDSQYYNYVQSGPYRDWSIGDYNVLSTTYQGAEADSFANLRTNNMGQAGVKLGDLAKRSSDMSVNPNPWLSLVFYVDFSQLRNFKVAATISSYMNGAADNFALDMGSEGDYKILNPADGTWVSCKASSSYVFTSEQRDNAPIALDNYKGYIMIPLYHFKQTGTNNVKLDESAEGLNNIFRVSIGVAPNSTADAAAMDGKTYTIDNIGFSYDAVAYADKVAARGIADQTFDEMFGVKALPSEQFEEFVAAIDPYSSDGEARAQQCLDAYDIYNALSDYQKGLASVQQAKATLDTYATGTVPQPIVTNPADLVAAIAALPEAARTAVTTGAGDLPSPGFVASGDTFIVNYAAYGITAAQADEIIALYELSYRRYSAEGKAAVTNSAELLAAYAAAKRCKGLDPVLADLLQVEATMSTDIYSQVVGTDRFTEISNRARLAELAQDYFDISYSGKLLLARGQTDTRFQNFPPALVRLLRNTDSVATISGETVEGGVLHLQQKYQELYTMASDRLSNKSLFTAAELQALQAAVEEYDVLLPAYHDIYELYTLIEQIKALFPQASADMTTSEILLSPDAMSGTSTYQLTYSENFPAGENTAQNYVVVRVKGQGLLENADGIGLPALSGGAYEVHINGLNLQSDAINGNIVYQAPNNVATPATPQTWLVEVQLDQLPVTTAPVLTSELYFDLCASDGTVLETKTLKVQYSMEDQYVVSIPAEIPVDWGRTDANDVSYRMSSTLMTGSSVTVSIADNGANTMTCAGSAHTLSYATSNFGSEIFILQNNEVLPQNIPTVTISGWEDVPVAEYRSTLTYTVEYTPNT